ARYVVLGNYNCSILGNITCSLLSSLFNNEASKPSHVNILSTYHRVFYHLKKRLYRFLNINFLNSCFISDFCNDFCLGHVCILLLFYLKNSTVLGLQKYWFKLNLGNKSAFF